MSELHCLYCDRPLALMHRLTGDKEFCSKEHRRIYQEQHSQMALARLLQAQPGPKEPPPLKEKGKPPAGRGRPEPQSTVQVRHVPQAREGEPPRPSSPPPPAPPREAVPATTARERTALITPEPEAEPPRPEAPRAEPPRAEPPRSQPPPREAAPRDVKPAPVRPAVRTEVPPARETPRAAPPPTPPPPPEPVPPLARFRPLAIEFKAYPATLRFPETRRFTLPIARSMKHRARVTTVFLTPGAFVRRRIQPATPEWAKGSTFRLRAAAFSNNEPQLTYLEDRLTGSDRIGFCPP